MTMSNREHLICLSAFTALVAFSGISRADDYALPNTDRFERPAELSQPATCAQAQAFAWFRHQMELSDGGTENTIPAPVECERTYVAVTVGGDREVIEESK
jgi:hypothetical protein